MGDSHPQLPGWFCRKLTFNYSTNAGPDTSDNPFIKASLLAEDPTTAWWVSGAYPFPRGYPVNLDKRLTFANGEHVVMYESGTFMMYRPQAKISPWATSVHVIGDKLQFADPPKDGMTFSNTVVIPQGFSGSVDWVQVNYATERKLQHTSSTWYEVIQNGSGPYLDTDRWYSKRWQGNPVDSPWLPLTSWAVRGVASDTFTMWMEFRPDGGEWVPLRAVGWYWSGTATNGTYVWGLESGNNSPNPINDYDTENYPLWNSNITNAHWNPAWP